MGSANARRAWGRRGPRELTFAAPCRCYTKVECALRSRVRSTERGHASRSRIHLCSSLCFFAEELRRLFQIVQFGGEL